MSKLLFHMIQLLSTLNKTFMESSYKLFEERSSGDSKLRLIHLQIKAETPLFQNDLTRWKRNLEDILELLVRFYVFITVSLKGHIISVLKSFDPFSTYNLYFPRKEILEWFGDYRVSERAVGIGLPPNLKTNKDWRGIAICAAFSVQEHPNAILDDENLHVLFRLLCHLSMDQECCLNPTPMFQITKDKFKWSYEFVQKMIYNSCFPPTEIPEYSSSNHHSSGHSVTIEIPTNLYSDGNRLGVAVYVYLSPDGQ
ncbi:hypothetical protein FEM48_Zijuj10G0166800 [Ziziphus jujuba var. spinosa]|uniref:Uncharacterized protein n=1 Tax=Ziziphus jujuba var. spinosa TaxID=714518 RepID=A0A978UPI6_ZIZJJ|nr:hypothetical protein FEM48_Zijuj10G0166800 [Ziziphus jujuba var. spinosa]